MRRGALRRLGLLLLPGLGLGLLALGAGRTSAGRAAPAGGVERADALAREIDAALERGAAWLVGERDDDGAWRSAHYRALSDGWSLTLPSLKVLAYLPGVEGRAVLELGVERLVLAAERGDLAAEEIAYPVYTASLAVMTLARVPESTGERRGAACSAWLAHLVRQQFDAANGWNPAHASYGGFGGGPLPPRPDGLRVVDADLSSTLFALGALRAAGVPTTDPRVQAARGFVERCQNLPLELASATALDAALDDGGFFLSPSDAARNKAGMAGVDESGRLRGRSYASATADGLRALLASGSAHDDARVASARRWLELRFDPERNAGDFPPERGTERAASYHYAAWSVAHAFARLGAAQVETASGRVAWAPALARALLARQLPDGSFVGDAGILLEDDPLVATPLALGALASCRLALVAGRADARDEGGGGCPISALASRLGVVPGLNARAEPRSRRP